MNNYTSSDGGHIEIAAYKQLRVVKLTDYTAEKVHSAIAQMKFAPAGWKLANVAFALDLWPQTGHGSIRIAVFLEETRHQ